MAIPHAKSGEVIDIRPLGPHWPSQDNHLGKDQTLEIIRLVIPSGKDIPEHQCPEKYGPVPGRSSYLFGRHTRHDLAAGQCSISRVQSPIRSTGSKTPRSS